MRTRNWSRKKLFTFSFINIMLVLLLLEVIFRIVFAIEYKGLHTSVYIQGSALHKSDSTLVFRNRPYYVAHDRSFQFNEEGMRCKAGEFAMPVKNENEFWVFLFGGSAMEGAGSNKDGEWLDITGVTDHAPDHTIAAYLQQYLQQQMPSKKVRVFNAANSSYTIWQSMQRYRQLSEKYKIDWVISMDGENEPRALKEGETPEAYVRQQWQQSPLFKFPHNVIVPVTARSAFINKLKQSVYSMRHARRLAHIRQDNYPARRQWLARSPVPLQYATDTLATVRAGHTFYDQLLRFDSLLTAKGQPHLLYVQPHIMFRDTLVMTATEKALYHYFTYNYNDPLNNAFKRKLHSSFGTAFAPPAQVRSMNALLSSKEEIFVDYCHFTEVANRIIAKEMAEGILRKN